MPAPQVAVVIEQLEGVVRAFCKVKNLETARIETLRWDQPSITTTWEGADHINRSLGLLVQDNDRAVAFEVNAWLDDETNLKRKWLHLNFGKAAIEKYTGTEITVIVLVALEDMFGRVSRVTERELVNVDELLPIPKGGVA